MNEEKTVEILKNAILLEKRGQAFYGKVAEQASGKAVKEFFEMMAEEEIKHVKILSDQFKAYQQDHEFTPGEYNKSFSGNIASKVLTEQLKKELSAAGFVDIRREPFRTQWGLNRLCIARKRSPGVS